MEHHRFDDQTQALARRLSRRRFGLGALRLLASLGFGAGFNGESQARKRHKKRCPQGKLKCPARAGKRRTTRCVDVQTDLAHCGSCGNACGQDQTCGGGRCMASTPTCPEGTDAAQCDPSCFFGCLQDGQCRRAAVTPPQQSDQVCGLMGERCVDCGRDAARAHCCAGECLACCHDDHCDGSAGGPACCHGVCGECFTDAHCSAHPDRSHCAGSPHCGCVECTRDSHCPAGRECHLDTFTCQPSCTGNADCPDVTNGFCCERTIVFGEDPVSLQIVHECMNCCLDCQVGEQCVTNYPVPGERPVAQCCPDAQVCRGSRTGCCSTAPGGPPLTCVERVSPPAGTPTHACVTG